MAKKVITFIASRRLYFSHPNATPPIIKPTKTKEAPHKKYINPKDSAQRGNIYNTITLCALPPASQLNIPRSNVIAPNINEALGLNSLISWVSLSKKQLIFLNKLKKSPHNNI